MKVKGFMGFAVVTVAIGAAMALFATLRPGESQADFWATLKPGDKYPGCAWQAGIVTDGQVYSGPLVDVDCIYLGRAPDGSIMIEVPSPYNPKDFVPENLRSQLPPGDPDVVGRGICYGSAGSWFDCWLGFGATLGTPYVAIGETAEKGETGHIEDPNNRRGGWGVGTTGFYYRSIANGDGKSLVQWRACC